MTLYHFIITLTWPDSHGQAMATLNGTIPINADVPEATRMNAYTGVLGLVRKQNPHIPANANVVFYDLAPNSLGDAARVGGAA